MFSDRSQRPAPTRLGIALLVLGVLATEGCVQHGLGTPDPCCSQPVSLPQSADRAVDLLFVVDNSLSLGGMPEAIQVRFSSLIYELRSSRGGLPDLHVGVTSTDLGAGGFDVPGCETTDGDGGALITGFCRNPAGASFIVDVEPKGCDIEKRQDATGGFAVCPSHACTQTGCPAGTVLLDDGFGCPRCRNFEGQVLEEVFACNAGEVHLGCGFEQPMEAMRRALDGSNVGNRGFLRQNALLAVVFVTDEDDCSVADLRIFDAEGAAMDSPLGPFTDFRCFEFGVTCDVNDRAVLGPRSGCKPREDDGALLHPIGRYVEFLRGLKDPQMLVLAAIAGPANGGQVSVSRGLDDAPEVWNACAPSTGFAKPGIRLHALVEAFHSEDEMPWAYFSLCSPAYSDSLGGIGRALRGHLEAPCLPAPLESCVDPGAEHGAPRDADAGNDVCLPRCAVTDVLARGTPEEARHDVVPCLEVCPEGACPGNVDRALAYAGGHPPLRDPGLPVEACFHVGWNPRCEASHFGELLVARRVDPPPRTFAEVSCAYVPQTEQLCNDGLDNDEDGLVDLEDPDCHW